MVEFWDKVAIWACPRWSCFWTLTFMLNNFSEYMMLWKPTTQHWLIKDVHSYRMTMPQHTLPMWASANLCSASTCLQSSLSIIHGSFSAHFNKVNQIEKQVPVVFSSFLPLNQPNCINMELSIWHHDGKKQQNTMGYILMNKWILDVICLNY